MSAATSDDNAHPERLNPLPGEAGIPSVAAGTRHLSPRERLLAFTAVALAAAAAALWAYSSRAPDPARRGEAKPNSAAQPAAASVEPRRLLAPAAEAASMPPIANVRTPMSSASAADNAMVAEAARRADPIGLLTPQQPPRSGVVVPSIVHGTPDRAAPSAEDGPMMLVSMRGQPREAGRAQTAMTPVSWASAQPSARDPLHATARNLEGYQQQLQGLLDTLSRTTQLASGTPPAEPAQAQYAPLPTGGPAPSPLPGQGLFGGQLQASSTPRVSAGHLGNRSLLLPKGTAFTCALTSRVISASSGLVGCQVQRHVYSEDGRVLLIERGSHVDGEYRIAQVRQGMVRIPVLWTRIRTPHGVTVDLESPATGPLGESGMDGQVDNRWPERIGAALLLSLIDDAVKISVQDHANAQGGNTIVLPSTTANASKLAEKVLDSTINIPPLISTVQGSIVGIYVARDVDFSSVYELRPSAPR